MPVDDALFKLAIQLGAGVASLFIVWKILEIFVGKRKSGNGGASGEKTVDFWRSEMRHALTEVLKDIIVPLNAREIEILNANRAMSQEIKETLVEIKVLVSDIPSRRTRRE